ncbi:DUF2218 domain-containing protein [Luteimonas aquatica]|uniref:DUF2218 domain-containing protein n=1 Tax=Luteimonas aquatica TaxID=450364 RepID=UPI001F59799A|nr:DUF2218 domain-containing protein [Luteimonas aquatica]
MATTSASIPTADGARLVKRLCAHWGHKFQVESGEGHGRIAFDAHTQVRLDASDAALEAVIDAADPARAAQLQPVVAEHLNRMARGEVLAVAWSAIA